MTRGHTRLIPHSLHIVLFRSHAFSQEVDPFFEEKDP